MNIWWAVASTEEAGLHGLDPASFLSGNELKKLNSLRFKKRRREWLLGRWTAKKLVKRSLKRFNTTALDEIEILNDPLGAPFFSAGRQEPYPAALSISHRDPFACCALCPLPQGMLGVDIERVESRAAVFLEDYFTEDERSFAKLLDEEARIVWVTAAWSLKESVLKALGKGLRLDTRRIALDFLLDPSHFQADPAGWARVKAAAKPFEQTDVECAWRRFGGFVLSAAFSNPQSAEAHDLIPSLTRMELF